MTPTTLSVPEDGVASSLAGMLHARARQSPDTVVLTALDADGAAVARLTASEADIEARTLAAELRATAEPGDRILLPSMPGLKFHTAFLACLYAGLVAVPAPPVRAARRGDGQQPAGVRRLAAICHDVRPAAVVVPANRLFKIAAAWAEEKTLAALPLVCCEPADALREPLPAPEPVAPDALAFLQYTSGSTSEPRGVMITHGAMLANQAALRERLSITTRTTLVSWLPTFHDLGLALGVLQPMYTGSSAVVMEPETFLRRPERWLQALSKRSDAVSAAPDFAYAWCAARVSPQAKAELDLSGWRVAVNGAEPLRADTVRDFHSAFAGCGLREHAQTSAYGLAEATLFVSGGAPETAAVIRRYDRDLLSRGVAVTPAAQAGPAGAAELIGCGQAGAGVRIAVVNPMTQLSCPQRVVGEIWVHSPSSALGYWGRPQESRETFVPRPADQHEGPDEHWLRTGDLGFIDQGELFVTGRRKDVLVVRGANYYPQDFEQLVQRAHPLFRGRPAAACATESESRVVVAVETADAGDGPALAEAAAAAVRAVTAELPVTTDVVVTSRGALPRTTSGKTRRRETAAMLRSGRLPVLAQWPREFP